MPVTLDNLARELMGWFGDSQNLPKPVWNSEGELVKDFSTYLNSNSRIKVYEDSKVKDSLDNSHLLLSENNKRITDGIIAKFVIDSNKSFKQIDEIIMNSSFKLNEENLKEDYHNVTKCIVSVYSNLKNRSKFHEIEFIEIYQRNGIGCAIKRLK